ncbi:helix-turn-helix domain-containing protein [Kribbella sp. NPDC056951]|uniref:helix-turn-helix domain-containing protein n=1 Tax=Kribbella sp. NPDC056951 TaxID=3345978 RepID=UPI0036314C57
MPEFGPVLRRFRKAAGLSQERLAAASGVSVEAIKTLESGRRRYPRSSTLKLLANGLGLAAAQRAELLTAGARTKARVTIPRELPDDVYAFVGREDQVAELEKTFTAQESRPGVVVTSAIGGMGGIGKTALAIHMAHLIADQYPDGQLYLNLGGFGPGRPLTVPEALGRLMDSLGVQGPDNPADAHEAASRYRSALTGRRVLVVLDNAADAAQVAPLLPGASTCAVLITSRRAMTALPGVAHVLLDVLPDQDGIEMLTQIVGDDRIARDQANALAIVRLCGGLPLALHLAGARLADEPTWAVADLVHRLETSRHRLDELATADRDVRASIEFSLSAATDRDTEAVEAFKLLGLHEGDELNVRVAAALLDLPVEDASRRLERLVDLYLIESVGPHRYRIHDLVRSYVSETTAALTTEADRDAARLRVLRMYLALAWRSRELNFTTALTTDWSDSTWTEGAEGLSMDEIFGWLDGEIEEIIGAVRRAARGSGPERALVPKVVLGLLPYCHVRRRYYDGVMLATIALGTVESGDDPFAAALTPYELAQQCGAAGLYSLAVDYMRMALKAPKTIEYGEQLAEGEIFLGEYLMELGRLDEASASAQAGVARAVELGEEITEADGRLILGTIAGRQGRPDEQDKEFQRAVDVVRRRGTPQTAHYILLHVGIAYRDSGQLLEAAAYFEMCRTSALAAGYEHAVAEALEGLGQVDLAHGNLTAAETNLRGALTIMQGTWQPEARVRQLLGQVLHTAGRPTEASVEWRSALNLLVRHGSPQADDVRALLGSDD